MFLWLVAQANTLLAWWYFDLQTFYWILTEAIVFLLIRTLYKYFPFQIQSKAKDYQTDK